uniref:Secretory phospholipase A2 receptor n=1 Tax=Magallana gigas TaxID=29159 RepID=K1QX68_MAGGI
MPYVSSTNQNCPLYWTAYGNVCYRFRWVNLKSWVEAKTWCAAQGGDLLKLENASEKTYITNAIRNLRQHNHLSTTLKWWTGMNNKNPQSQAWVWGDNSPVAPVIISSAHLHPSTTDHCVYTSETELRNLQQVCSRNGGDLVEIDNDQDQIAIHDFARNTHKPLWTALHSVQKGTTNSWQWLNGTVLSTNPSLQYWANGHPPVLRR